MIKEGDLIRLLKKHDNSGEEKIGVLIKAIYESEYSEILPNGVSGWLCLVDGEVGVYQRPYWEIEKWES